MADMETRRTRTVPTLEDVVLSVSTWVFRLSAVVLFIMIFSIGYEVVMRYVFRSPTLWATEYSGYFLVVITFLGASYVQRLGRHVMVDILVVRFPGSVQKALAIFTTLVALGYVSILGWQAWGMALKSLELNRKASTLMETPLFYPQVTIPIGCFLLCLVFIVQLYRHVKPGPSPLPTKVQEGDF